MDVKEQKVIDAMKQAKKELKTAEISELSGVNKKDVSKIIANLKKIGLIESPKRCYYKVKE